MGAVLAVRGWWLVGAFLEGSHLAIEARPVVLWDDFGSRIEAMVPAGPGVTWMASLDGHPIDWPASGGGPFVAQAAGVHLVQASGVHEHRFSHDPATPPAAIVRLVRLDSLAEASSWARSMAPEWARTLCRQD